MNSGILKLSQLKSLENSTVNKIFCMDVDYRDGFAIAAGILFDDWSSEQTLLETCVKVDKIEEYESGKFYKRELPCLLKLIQSLDTLPDIFLVDSFVYLDDRMKPGLGAYLYNEFNGKIPVIGVAKTNFKECSNKIELLRGESKSPLFISSAGIDLEKAAEFVSQMHGEFRNPTLLKKVDRLCREYC